MRDAMVVMLASAFLALPLTAAEPAKTGKAGTPVAAAAALDPASLRGLAWRNIGPFRGGRSVAVAGVPSQPRVYYFGGTGGGVWKTTDAGIDWSPVTDGQLGTASVGAIGVAPSDPNVVWVGMGESCIRGNFSHGDGVYRSTDAGKTWKHLGLRDTRQIGRVRVHPTNPDVAWVAALGHASAPNKDRGVFRTKDGGATWEKVLFVDDKTGAVDLALDPTNPRVLYAGFWQVVRTPHSMESGGPGSSLWKSVDGGDTWTRLTGEGLPSKGVWGKIGVTVSPANPDRVFAIIEAEDGGVFRSDDAGKTWRRTNEERKLRQRAWYYSHIYADPRNADTLYVLNVQFFRSQDGGKTFTPVGTPHGDNHDLWIAPDDPQRMIGADDGGAHVSFDGGATWSRQDNQPTAQLYHVIADNQFPYHLYGAQQDNSTLGIASRTSGAGIDRTDWYIVGGCESGYIAPHPVNHDVSYAGCYDGVIERFDRRTGQARGVDVYPDNPMGWGAEGMKYRFQWTFPIVFSPHDPGTLYAAGNLLFKTTNEGQSWEAISPDLTRNDPKTLGPSGGPITKDNTSVEYYGTIFAFAESKREKGLLWAGSDDGLVHVSRDAGKNWTNVTPKDLPEWSMVSQIDPSPHDAGTMYLAVNRYKLDDYRPYLYVTTDYGKTWKKIVNGLPEDSFTRVVREDPVKKGLLFAGTETAVHVSFDNGGLWQPLQMALPPAKPAAKAPAASETKAEDKPMGLLPVTPITDLIVKDDDVVVSTEGRSFWILDDITPLRQMSGASAEDVRLFKPRVTHRVLGGGGFRPPAQAGQNPPGGVLVSYSLKNELKEADEITLEFLDANGKLVRKVSNKDKDDEPGPGGDFGRPAPANKPSGKAGLNRFAWDMRYPDASKFKGMILWGGNVRGPVVVPGTYQVKLTVGGQTKTESFEIKNDPRVAVTAEALQEQLDLLLKIRDKLTETNDAVARIREVREQVNGVVERAKGAGDNKAIAEAAEAMGKKLTAVEEELYQTKNQSSQDPLNFPVRLNNKLAALGGLVAGADARPTDQSHTVYKDLSAKIDVQLGKLKDVLATDLAAFNKTVREQDVPAVVLKQKK